MLRYKSQVALVIVGAVAAGIFLLLFFIHIFVDKGILRVEETVILSVEVDDIGTEIISILNSRIGDVKYIEILGDLDTENAGNIDTDFVNTLEKIKEAEKTLGYTGYNFTVYNSATPSPFSLIKSYGSESEVKKGISTEIALPGARAGKCKGLVRLEKW